MFKTKKIDNKEVYYSDILDIEHFFTSRKIPISENKKIIAQYLNIKEDNLIKPTQTHSDNVEIFEENIKDYPNCDALILDRNDYGIYLNFADCTPIILYDKKNNIGAIAHAGWRGTAQKIGIKTFLKMQEKYNSKPENIIAIIGPCISYKYFETYDEALVQLKNSVKKTDKLFNNNYADLKGINKRQLEEIGIFNIDVCPYCTIDDNDKFFSYRKENKTTQRHSAVLKIN